MKKTVLLVEPRKHKMALASLMKFSTYFSAKGYRVVYTEGVQFFGLPKKVDKVVVSSVFTFDIEKVVECVNYYKSKYQLDGSDVHVGGIAVSLMYDYVKEKCGDVDIHVGICNKIDQLPLDYSLYPDIDYSIVWTTRGCIRHCEFCAIPKFEGKLQYIDKWEKQINMNKPRILAIDNNFTAAKKDWFARVCQRLSYFGKLVDFNQSLDVRLFKEFHAQHLSKVRLLALRFSYDGLHVDRNKVIKGIELAREYKFNDIRFDVLFNFEDTPEDLYERMNLLNELDCKVFVMKYVPLNSLNRNHIGENWSKQRLGAFSKVLNSGFSRGMIGNASRNTFLKTFGNTSEEFIKKLDNIYIDEYDKEDKSQFTLDKWV